MLDPFYLIVDSAAWLARLLPCGVRLVQLRIKDNTDSRSGESTGASNVMAGLDPAIQTPRTGVWMPGSTPGLDPGAGMTAGIANNEGRYEPGAIIRAEIAKAKALCARYGAKLVVNDYWQQAIDAGCDFIHLGQGDLATADLSAIRRAGMKFGVSTHDEAELSRALDASPDYIALGPIYPTVLKAMAFAPQGLPRITEWKNKIGKIPLVGIGGITLERAAGVLEAGADSAAVVTDISLNAAPEQRARDWVKATRAFVKIASRPADRQP